MADKNKHQRPRKKKNPTSMSADVDAIRHKEKRKNIPTEELRDFVAAAQPPKMLYPRDPPLDPQLMWKGKDEQGQHPLEIDVNWVNVHDPTTGQIRSSSTDDIACWFIDTDYNGECFFVRHAYFLGADDPYGKLKRALRAEIDEAQWATLYSSKSYPFEPPASGKIAVKIINHYGDEVLKVYKL
jgi:hypothetical protein